MRVVFIGASELAINATELLIDRGDEVIIIEKNKEIIDELSDDVDCGFLHGDASKPAILQEASPENTDVLFCLTSDDRVNIIASLIGKNLGYHRVVTKIEDAELKDICLELDLKDTIIPSKTIGRFLADLVRGPEILELSTIVRGEARFFSFKVSSRDSGKKIEELELPEDSRAILIYDEDSFEFSEPAKKLQEGNEVVILTHSKNLETLRERWAPEVREEQPSEEAAETEDEE